MDPLFPTLPDDLAAVDDEALSDLMAEHEVALDKIEAEDAEFTAGYTGSQIIEALASGADQVKAIKAEQSRRVEEHQAYQAEKARLSAEARGLIAEPAEDDADGDGDAPAETLAAETEPEVVAETVEEPVAVVASAAPTYRRAPAASTPIRVISEDPVPALVAAAGVAAKGIKPGQPLDRMAFANLVVESARRMGRPMKSAGGSEDRTTLASIAWPFPEERRLRANDHEGNMRKIQMAGNPFLGKTGIDALVASGGLCAPLTPFYDQPMLATAARPVRDALPSYMAERGGVSVPAAGSIADITTAISVITEEEDALGGTYATKSCQDLTCPTWTDVAVTVIAHCREYGNLNAMAWPEGIAFQNDLTMAAHSRSADGYLLTRIGSLSVALTFDQGADAYGAVSGVLTALIRSRAQTISYLRMLPTTRFRALLPFWVADAMAVDTVNTQFGRFDTPQDAISALLGRYNIDVNWYLDTADGAGQVYSAETASAVDDFPQPVGYLFPEGTFLHIDGGDLELGIVRDSTLNSTNDFQVFGETFENVARIGPAQAAKKITFSNFCPSGEVAAPGTAISC